MKSRIDEIKQDRDWKQEIANKFNQSVENEEVDSKASEPVSIKSFVSNA
jgi:hypothetical protein